MKANKKGISLIVLVITIIVIIILAAAIILTMNNNNPISNAKTAVTANDASEAQSAVTTYLGTLMAKYKDAVSLNGTVGTVEAGDTAISGTYGTDATAISETPTLADLGLDNAGLKSVTITNNKVTKIVYTNGTSYTVK